jgi:hypothetical protein
MATRSNLVKVSIFMTRKEGVSEADFHRYWTERHSEVVSERLQRNGVVRYSQVSASVVLTNNSLANDGSSIHPRGHETKQRRASVSFHTQLTNRTMALWRC